MKTLPGHKNKNFAKYLLGKLLPTKVTLYIPYGNNNACATVRMCMDQLSNVFL